METSLYALGSVAHCVTFPSSTQLYALCNEKMRSLKNIAEPCRHSCSKCYRPRVKVSETLLQYLHCFSGLAADPDHMPLPNNKASSYPNLALIFFSLN